MKRLFFLLTAGFIILTELNAQVLYTPGGTVGNNATNGYVGIGINAPGYKLHVKSETGANYVVSERAAKSNGEVGYLLGGGTNGVNWYMYQPTGSNDIRFYDVADRITFQNGGNVGIGTTSPACRLNISAVDASLQFRLERTNSAAGYVDMGADNLGFHLYPSGYSSGEKFTILQSGNVGIGTTNPFTKLMIANVVNGVNTARIGFYGQTGDGNNTDNGGVRFINDNSPYYSEVAGYRGGDSEMAGLHFYTASHATPAIRMTILPIGNVLIGKETQSADYKLDVAGRIRANEVVVNTSGADFVFAPDYKLLTLPEVESFIKENKHLPDLASATEMKENGMNVSEMQTKLLQKMEEMTLYIIEQNKKNELQSREIELLKQEIAILRDKK